MKAPKTIILFLSIMCLAITAYGIYTFSFKTKIAYISLPDVFNGFDLKKELEVKFKKVKDERERVIDSLSFELNLLSKKIQSEKGSDKARIEEFSAKREHFLKKKQEFEEDNDALSKKYDKQILDQLNQYVMDYGRKHNFSMILGSDSNGNLMYAEETFNISADVIQFINSKYKGIE